MPTYEYRCTACGHEFEEFQSIMAKPLRTCPKCKKAKAKRLISSGGGFIFKGGGFWQTDYRSESYKKGEKAEADAASASTKSDAKPEAKVEGKSDAKPEAKSERKSDAAAKSESPPAAKTADAAAPKSSDKPKSEDKPARPGKKNK